MREMYVCDHDGKKKKTSIDIILC